MQDTQPFPLISDTINNLKIKLAEAEWEDDQKNIEVLREEILQWQYIVSLGEKYHVPF